MYSCSCSVMLDENVHVTCIILDWFRVASHIFVDLRGLAEQFSRALVFVQ